VSRTDTHLSIRPVQVEGPEENQSSDRDVMDVNNGKQPDRSFCDARVHKGTLECGVPLESEPSCTRASTKLVRLLVMATTTRTIFQRHFVI
jgi:hypothetical protein